MPPDATRDRLDATRDRLNSLLASFAGHGTTNYLLDNALRRLSQEPALVRGWRGRPTLIANAIEETLALRPIGARAAGGRRAAGTTS